MRATLATLFAATFLLLAGAGPAFAAPEPSPSATSRTNPEYWTVVGYDSGKLTYVRVKSSGDRLTADVSDMNIDTKCAFDWLYNPNDSIRINLLEQGCATLLPGKGTAEEKEAQKRAPSPGATTTKPGPPPGSASGPNDDSGPDVVGAVGGWIGDHWEVLLSTLLGVGSLSWTVWTFYNRRIRVVLIGAPAAGKTGLWTALKEGRSPGNLTPTVGQSAPTPMEPIPFGKYTLYPAVTDIAGAEPGRVLDELEHSRSFRWKRKLVLVVVVAPTAKDGATGADPFDRAFIDVQKGYMSLPRGIVGSRNKRRRPDLVLLFISKFDLVANVRPDDSAGEADRVRVLRAFSEHENLLRSICRAKSVPFHAVVGSSTRGWGMDDLRRRLQAVIKP